MKKTDPEAMKRSLEEIARRLKADENWPKVMLVEDSDSDGAILLHALNKFGINPPIWFRDSRSALDALYADKDYRLMFLDLKMPGMSPLEAITEARKIAPTCYIVVLTGAFDHSSPECHEALKRGADCVMLKPLEDEQVKLLFGVP